jgi:hypothetical protein
MGKGCVVPAKTGAHTPQQFGSINLGSFVQNCERQGLWIPAFAGAMLFALQIRAQSKS